MKVLIIGGTGNISRGIVAALLKRNHEVVMFNRGQHPDAPPPDAHGLSVIHLRPGVIAGDGLNPGPTAPASLDQARPTEPWFVYVDPRDVAQAVELAIETQDVMYGSYNVVAGRGDSRFDWKQTAQELGYRPEHNWDEIPENSG